MKRISKNNLKTWSAISSKEVHKNPWFGVVHEEFITPKNTIGNYYVIHTKEGKSALIVPIDNEEMVLIRQYRYVAKSYFLEVPGGAVEKGCSVREAAKQELLEELGYLGKLKKIGQYRPWSPASEVCTVFLATDLVYVGQKLEETEHVKEKRMKIKDVYHMLDDGKFKGAQTIAALSFARKYLLKD